jgi:hypothetical protein
VYIVLAPNSALCHTHCVSRSTLGASKILSQTHVDTILFSSFLCTFLCWPGAYFYPTGLCFRASVVRPTASAGDRRAVGIFDAVI